MTDDFLPCNLMGCNKLRVPHFLGCSKFHSCLVVRADINKHQCFRKGCTNPRRIKYGSVLYDTCSTECSEELGFACFSCEYIGINHNICKNSNDTTRKYKYTKSKLSP
jgi:hypothetical protein